MFQVFGVRWCGRLGRPRQCALWQADGRGFASSSCGGEKEKEKEKDRGQGHWLSKHFPNQEEWLLKQAKEWWFKGLSGLCNELSLGENHDLIVEQVRERSAVLERENGHHIVDGRSRTHLQQACLALATNKAISPWVGDTDERLVILSRLLGKDSEAIFNPLQKVAIMLSRDKMAMISKRLKLLKLDYGQAFDMAIQEEEGECTLQVNSCFYARFFQEMGSPELTSVTCCSVDSLWFDSSVIREKARVEFSRPSSISEGDCKCVLKLVTRQTEA
ncbi:hypothetical protein HOP50_02g14430 [Chloropicon primus]|uniref:Uncharacterized protein n=1 Tax=Chloropicon primus TaxID=1764295 RepID=A0A5B8MEW2_9CHLO|nr:hypothetical protein A3770_02p14550 [Chloropicon primus]UPQ98145.1 hypothetical protein HOP50_02g14430 [Chloropicon primus]|eukprot:QDZ18937.1 hypothetical protein A3770_02p14550 [Chloropicon primus]